MQVAALTISQEQFFKLENPVLKSVLRTIVCPNRSDWSERLKASYGNYNDYGNYDDQRYGNYNDTSYGNYSDYSNSQSYPNYNDVSYGNYSDISYGNYNDYSNYNDN